MKPLQRQSKRARHLAFAALLCGAGAVGTATAPTTADAFCGFYVGGADTSLFNEATTVVLMRDGRRTVLSMENHYSGPLEDFAMVVPVPQILEEANVKTLPTDVFARVDQMGAPRLVEYWEMDPCTPTYEYENFPTGGVQDAATSSDTTDSGPGGVVIEAEFTVGEYHVVILSADDATGLEAWLTTNEYTIPADADELLRPYIESGMYFFVAKVNVDDVEVAANGDATLSPLRFHYDADDFALPIRLGLVNAVDGGKQDLIVNILARDQRYEVANYPNVQIPTNIAVTDEVRDQFAEFYVELMDETLAQNPGAVITEYSWNASTCDPCPGATLTPDDFATLGADVATTTGGGELFFDSSWVLTRLHARYDGGEVGDDLVFGAAPPIVGGRGTPDERGHFSQDVETGADAYRNNFQGRYAILHPWEGTVDCGEPNFGRWGGPPTGTAQPAVRSARDTAFAERGAVDLKGVIAADIDQLGVTALSENVTGSSTDRPSPSGGGCAAVAPTTPRGGLVALLVGALAVMFSRRTRRDTGRL